MLPSSLFEHWVISRVRVLRLWKWIWNRISKQTQDGSDLGLRIKRFRNKLGFHTETKHTPTLIQVARGITNQQITCQEIRNLEAQFYPLKHDYEAIQYRGTTWVHNHANKPKAN